MPCGRRRNNITSQKVVRLCGECWAGGRARFMPTPLTLRGKGGGFSCKVGRGTRALVSGACAPSQHFAPMFYNSSQNHLAAGAKCCLLPFHLKCPPSDKVNGELLGGHWTTPPLNRHNKSNQGKLAYPHLCAVGLPLRGLVQQMTAPPKESKGGERVCGFLHGAAREALPLCI